MTVQKETIKKFLLVFLFLVLSCVSLREVSFQAFLTRIKASNFFSLQPSIDPYLLFDYLLLKLYLIKLNTSSLYKLHKSKTNYTPNTDTITMVL